MSISKKLLSLLLALLILAALAVPAFAAEGADPDEGSDPNTIATEAEDENDPEDDFDYDPEDDYYDDFYEDPMEGVIAIRVVIDAVGPGKVEQDNHYYPYAYEKAKPITMTAVPDEGAVFVKWQFENTDSLEFLSGSVDENGVSTDSVLVVKPSDFVPEIKAAAYFEKASENGTEDPGATPDQDDTADKSDKSATSPKTGDLSMAVVFFMLLAAVSGVLAGRKIREK